MGIWNKDVRLRSAYVGHLGKSVEKNYVCYTTILDADKETKQEEVR